MQQSHPDQQQAVQFSNQPMQPHMMLSPVQFIYDPQMLVPPDEHVQPSPSLLNQTFIVNLQNPPPWIQNRTNMVYMSQPYHHQNMVHNPMYNYQYQPVMMQQDQIRHMIPNLMNQNLVNPHSMVQNPQTMIQNPNMVQHSQNMIQNTQNMMQSPIRFQREIKQELPLLTHMLQNQVLRKPVINQQNDFVAPIQMIRPQYQNVHPQMLTVNPMPSNHTCVHHNSHQKEHQNSVNNEITQKNESPQHVRNQILDINVKTVFKVPITAMVRPTEYAFQNIAPADDAHPRVYHKPVMKHNTTNTEPKPNCKRKIRDMLEQNSKTLDSDVQAFKRNCPINKQDIADKIRSQMKTNISKPAINDVAAQNNILNSNRPLVSPKPQNNPVNDRPQKEEKLLRNTVYVQARGRVNEIKNEANNLNMGNAKFDVPIQNDTEINSPAQIALRVSPVPDKEVIPSESNSQNIKEVKITQVIEASGQNNSKITLKVENLEQTDIKEMMNINDAIKKYVLTHVLDGHIIQESNVPFLVQKPMPIKETPNNNPEENIPSSKETEIISSDNRETDISSNSVKQKNAETDNKRETYEKKEREAVVPKLVTLDCKTVNRVNEDDPFEYVSRSTVKTWTVSDVFSHLNRHNWRESALRLRDEEIDGESLLLVNKEQLLHIGICVNHVEILSAFLQRAQ